MTVALLSSSGVSLKHIILTFVYDKCGFFTIHACICDHCLLLLTLFKLSLHELCIFHPVASSLTLHVFYTAIVKLPSSDVSSFSYLKHYCFHIVFVYISFSSNEIFLCQNSLSLLSCLYANVALHMLLILYTYCLQVAHMTETGLILWSCVSLLPFIPFILRY